MTYHNDSTLSEPPFGTAYPKRTRRAAQALRVLLNAAMQPNGKSTEASRLMSAARSEPTTPTATKTRRSRPASAAVTCRVPQSANGDFYPVRSGAGTAQRTGLDAGASRNVCAGRFHPQSRGASSKNSAAQRQQQSGQPRRRASSTPFSQTWRERPLGVLSYLYLDARYESVRQEGIVAKAAVLIAVGVDTKGKRHILGVSVALSEQEAHWRQFLQGLVKRGLCGVRLLVSDAHEGLKAARQAVFGGVPWQRCQFHLAAKRAGPCHAAGQKAPVAADLRAVFAAANATRRRRFWRTVQKWQNRDAETGGVDGKQCARKPERFRFPRAHRRLLRTTNGVERVNKEVRRRTRVCQPVSQRGVLSASGLCGADGNQRRVADGQSLPDV